MWQIIINGPGYFDTAYDLPEGTTTLGRADENDIVLSGDLVSRKHARIHARGDALDFEDLGSRNGSRLNGQPLLGVVPLKVGDSVSVGENSLAVRRPAKSENLATEQLKDGVRRVDFGADISEKVLFAKEVKESFVLQALDNVSPFESDGAMQVVPAASTPIAYESLLLLYKTVEKLSSAPSLQAFLEQTMELVMARVEATTAVVLLRQGQGGVLKALAVRHRGKLAQGEVPVSDAVIDEALRKGQALAVADVRGDLRFAQRESVILYDAGQVLCVPIGSKEPFTGVLYLNRRSGPPDELEALLDLCTAVAHLIQTGVEKFGQKSQPQARDRLREALERFHAPDIVDRRVAELSVGGGGPITGLEEKTATIVFADIAGFTQLTQKLPPARLVEILNLFYARMGGIVFSFEGTVDKFLGDSIMAVFGAPYGKGDDAMRAVRTALTMRQEWERAMAKFPLEERCPLRIGINTGRVLAGTIGSEARLDYTAIGEPVNVAAWLCGIAAGHQLLITGKTLAAIGARFDVTPLGERLLKTGRDKVPVFEVIGEDVPQHTAPGGQVSG
jgi:adenylate cyclase